MGDDDSKLQDVARSQLDMLLACGYSGSYNAVFDSSTETERPEESESAGSAPSYESVAGGSNSTCESQSEAVYDLGHIIKSSMDSTEVCRAVCKLTDGQRYKPLKEHYRPETDFKFPKTFSNGLHIFSIQMA